MQPFCVEKHSIIKHLSNSTSMKTFFTLMIALSPFLVGAQCCPYINNIEIIPAVPTNLDDVKIVTTVTTPNQGMFLSSNYTINGNTINIEACYYSGLLTATQTYYDTLSIGTLSPGLIDVNFIAYQSSDTALCNYTDTMSTNENFTVLENTNSLSEINREVGRIYPNPNNGRFSIELTSDLQPSHIRITNISGKEVYADTYSNSIHLPLSPGTYLIYFLEENTVLGQQRLVVF